MSRDVIHGNAREDGARTNEWFVGHFMAQNSGLRADNVEVKWSTHPAGDVRPRWSMQRTATSLAILVRGHFTVIFPDRDVTLAQEGDYVLWRPGVPHWYRSAEESVIVTIRWPSVPGDQVEDDDLDRLLRTGTS